MTGEESPDFRVKVLYCRFRGHDVEVVVMPSRWQRGREEVVHCCGRDTDCYFYDCRFCHDTCNDGFDEDDL